MIEKQLKFLHLLITSKANWHILYQNTNYFDKKYIGWRIHLLFCVWSECKIVVAWSFNIYLSACNRLTKNLHLCVENQKFFLYPINQ